MLKKKSKAKSATKKKTKSTAKLKSKSASKTKLTAKKKTSSKIKAKPKAAGTRAKKASKLVAKNKSKINSKLKLATFNEVQKTELLNLIEKLVYLHLRNRGALTSFAGIADIMNKYNQHYIDGISKFDAIVKFGSEHDPRMIRQYYFINVDDSDADASHLFQLLTDIKNDKINFKQAKDTIENIYHQGLKIGTTQPSSKPMKATIRRW